jgi:hypothetical protein
MWHGLGRRRHSSSRSRGANAPELCSIMGLPKNGGRRECRCNVAPAASYASVESIRVSHHRYAETSGIPCTMVLTGYLVLTSERPGFVVSVACGSSPQDSAPATGAPGRHAFAVRIGAARLATRTRPSHPAPNVRDDREAPLCKGAGWTEINHDFQKIKRQLFLRAGLDRPNQVDFARENSLSAQRFWTLPPVHSIAVQSLLPA